MERSLRRHIPNKAYIVTTGSFHIASGACNRAQVRVREFGSRTSKIYIYIFFALQYNFLLRSFVVVEN